MSGSISAPAPASWTSVQVDAASAEDWDGIVGDFDDGSWEQTASWARARWGPRRSSQLVVSRDGVPVAGAETVVVQLPGIRRGIAYVKFGPLWRRRDGGTDPAIYRAAVSALVDEYCERRGHCLTILPRPSPDHCREEHAILAELGFRPRRRMADPNRYLVDLRIGAAERLRHLDQKWRYNLRRALRHRIECEVVDTEAGLEAFAALHATMVARKQLDDQDALGLLPELARRLPAPMRPRFVLARHEGRPIVGAVVAVCGDTAFYLFGASGDAALPLKAGYALQWWIVGWLSTEPVRWYDLGGEALTPGLRQFKKGLVGRAGAIVSTCRELDRYTAVRARLAADCIYGLRGLGRTVRSLGSGWRLPVLA